MLYRYNESATIIKASPSISTNASQVGNVVGSAVLSDSASISGGYMPGAGSVTFTLKEIGRASCRESADSDVGDGITNGTYTATAVGSYPRTAYYSDM